MATRVQENREESRYEVYADGELAGFTVYHLSGPHLALEHTEVDDRFEGQGLGSALARGVLDAARESGLAVLPFCPFIAAYIKEHPDDYLDLVPEGRRPEFDLGRA